MSRQIIASRYAEALFALAREENLLTKVEGDLELLAQTLLEEPELGLVLENQRIASEQKYQLIEKLFAGRFQKLTLNFMGVLTEKRREGYLEEIIASFRREADDFRGILEAEVRTALELPEAGKKTLAGQLAQATGKKIRLKYRVDPGLIAGAVVRIGDKVMDGSIATRLKSLQEELSG